MRSIMITLMMSCSLFLTGCGSGIGKSVGLAKRPWLPPVPEFSAQEKAEFAALKKDSAVLAKLQKNYLAYKAMFNIYMKEAWKVNLAQLDALGWKKDDSVYALTNELIKMGYDETQIEEFSK